MADPTQEQVEAVARSLCASDPEIRMGDAEGGDPAAPQWVRRRCIRALLHLADSWQTFGRRFRPGNGSLFRMGHDSRTRRIAIWKPYDRPPRRSGLYVMKRFEVNFRPTKRRVGGVHQPDVAYELAAETAADATAYARSLINGEHPGYLHANTREIAL